MNALNYAKEKGCKVLGMLNVLGSTLMNVSDVYLPIASGYEISVPATKTFLNQAIMFLYLAMRDGNQDTTELNKLPNLIQKTIDETNEASKALAEHIRGWKELYYLRKCCCEK